MARLAAWSLLRANPARPLAEVARCAAEHGLDERDRGLLRKLVGTELRRRCTLRALVRAFARGKPSAEITAHLHLGLVQLFFLDRVPDHAAVSETVRATADTVGLSKGRYVNGVLRAALRARRGGTCGDPRCDLPGRDLHLAEPVFRDPAEHPYLWAEDALNVPAALMKRWTQRHGEATARRLGATFLEEPPLSLRVVRGGRAEHLADLEAAGCEPRPGAHASVVLCPPGAAERAVATPAFRDGALTVQGETALRAAELVGARPGERVLDLCAAPGGKTAVLAGAGADVVALDASARRGADLRATVERLALGPRVRWAVSDGTAALARSPAARFDAVLVDAPCSNTGVLGARPAARWRYGPATRASLCALQERLLAEGAERVRPGGRLVWSTCSLEPEENGQLVRTFLAAHGDFELEVERESLPEPAGSESAEAGPADGGYAARLVRRGGGA